MMQWDRHKRLFVCEWQGPGPYESFAPLASQPYSLFLDSNRQDHPDSQYSYLCWHPFETIESKDGHVTVTNRDNQVRYKADVFQVVRERLSLWGDMVKPAQAPVPFSGGAAGMFGYDLGRGIEKIPSRSAANDMPDLCVGLYDKVLGFDHRRGKAWLMILAGDESEASLHRSYLERMIEQHGAPPGFYGCALNWTAERDDAAYRADIQKVIDYIYAGDIFQANLSRRFSADLPEDFDGYAHYGALRKINAAPYSAYMNFGSLTLASTSPEQFLSVKNRSIRTKPIKGTMPSSLPASDLLESEKNRAENAMIVDLLRNDLSKVCEDHSVDVEKLFDIETFEGLHHMVSTVRGVLRADCGPMDLLRACFPGGSITGAPKIRAMQIIEALEPHRRGPYCGALGFCGFDGTMETSIAIRTLIYESGKVHLQTGGGITAESVPQDELDETLLKADKMLESFDCAAECAGRLKRFQG